MKNYYEIFGINPDATLIEIKSAYRRLAHRFHPDCNHGKSDLNLKMAEINFIYSVLSNPVKRKLYDSSLSFFNENFGNIENFKFIDSIELTDSKGLTTNIKINDYIYFEYSVILSIFGFSIKKRKLLELRVLKIIDYKSLNIDNSQKKPVIISKFGLTDIIINKEDFECNWLSEKSLRKKEYYKLIAYIIIFALFTFLLIKNIVTNRNNIFEDNIQYNEYNFQFTNKELIYLKEYYYVSNREIKKIEEDEYLLCSKCDYKTNDVSFLISIPNQFGVKSKRIPSNSHIEILLYCPNTEFYKIRFGKNTGWIHSSKIENPHCNVINKRFLKFSPLN